MGYSQYFFLVHNIVKESKLMCGRGNGAASIVNYCLFITHYVIEKVTKGVPVIQWEKDQTEMAAEQTMLKMT